jgi:hypothetical protein
MVLPEEVEQFGVGDDRGVVFDLDHFGMAGFSGGDLLVARIFRAAPG